MARRVTFIYNDGTSVEWRADSARHGHESRNAILYRAELVTLNNRYPPPLRKAELVTIPLYNVNSVLEEPW